METEGDEKGRKEKIRNMKIYKYVGETARTCFERTREHLNDIDQLKTSRHMLKHLIDKPEKEDWKSVRFRVKFLYFTNAV